MGHFLTSNFTLITLGKIETKIVEVVVCVNQGLNYKLLNNFLTTQVLQCTKVLPLELNLNIQK